MRCDRACPSVASRGMSTQQREDTRAAWDAIAPGYDRTNTPTQMWLGNEGLLRAGLRAGMRFLDVAAGSGALSIPAARIGAHVLAVDQSPRMLELLEERARESDVDVETRVMDGHALELEDDVFDIAGSQFGVMLFPDMPQGVSELARVVKPGGRVLLTAYGDPHAIEFLGFFGGAISSVRPDFTGPPMDPPPLPFQLQDPERLRSELVNAGLDDVEVETVTEATEFETAAQLWDWIVCSNPIAEAILSHLGLSRAERETVRQALGELFRERAAADGRAVLTNPVHIGTATKRGRVTQPSG
jgi:ubiquinone/menaquinone biosynthesis C-methylase UbiE